MKPAICWTTTVLTAASMAASVEWYFARNRKMLAQFKALGDPAYFPTILGMFKLLGMAALLSPGRGLLEEWAYAGFSFTFLGAAASHLAKRRAVEAAVPLVSLTILAASSLTRPARRQVVESPRL